MSESRPAVRLSDQIMDELMEQQLTAADLAEMLAASYEGVRRALRLLEGDGLVFAASARLKRGKPEILWDMTRTTRTT